MEKTHVIEFSTELPIEEVKSKSLKFIEKAYKDDEKESAMCERFIGRLASLTKLTLKLTEEEEKTVDEFSEHLKTEPMRFKRSFVASFSKAFSEIAGDFIELANDYREINPDREEPRD